MATIEEIKLLSAHFPKEDISWRAQSVARSGETAMALAYIDARDVMERLDHIVGVGGWQDRYEMNGPRTVCYLSILVDGEWITKADGAGDTAVEAEKGAISDAFKRAAVKWGIGRYLYSMPAPWVPCESYENNNGKKVWKRWRQDPWSMVKDVGPSAAHQKRELEALDADLADCATKIATDALAKEWRKKMDLEHWSELYRDEVAGKFKRHRQDMNKSAEKVGDVASDIMNTFPGSKITNETNPLQAG